MALKEATVPDIGNYTDVPVIELLVKAGDTVKKDQGLITLESDKATLEVPAPFAGVVRELKVKIGDTLSEGAVVAILEEAVAAAIGAKGPVESTSPSAVAPIALPDKVVPTLANTAASASAHRPSHEVAVSTLSPPPAVAASERERSSELDGEAQGPRTPPVVFDASQVLPDKVPHASPAVRLFARELGVDLAKVSGSGRKGRLTKDDVQNFVKAMLQGGPSAARPTATASTDGLRLLPWPKVDFAKFGAVETQPLSKIKKISGANLARNWAMIPHVTQQDEADITEMEAFRKSTAEQVKDVKVTPLVFLIKAVVAALKRFPNVNASLDASAENLVLKKYFHIGIAVDTPDGLVVPVLRDCDQKGLVALAQELATVSAKARDKKLTPADMSGGCFSISSLGGIGGSGFTPIINAPEVAILGVSKSQTKPIWNGSEFTPRLMLPLSLSYDHRVIDGAEAARFTSYLAQVLGDIRRLLL